LYTWSQKNNLQLEFNVISETNQAGRKVFDVGIFINGYLEINATGYNKKEASQRAAEKALEEIIPNEQYPFQYLNHIESKIIPNSSLAIDPTNDEITNDNPDLEKDISINEESSAIEPSKQEDIIVGDNDQQENNKNASEESEA